MTPETTWAEGAIEPTFINLFNHLKARTAPGRRAPRLRFTTQEGRIDFFYFDEMQFVGVYYKKPKETANRIGYINSKGQWTKQLRTLNDRVKNNFYPLLYDLQTTFIQAVLLYGQHTGFCAICGHPLLGPSELKRGVGPTCYRSLITPTTAEDI